MRKGNKKTSRHGLFGWYLHGMKAGEPKPGRKAAMLRAYAEKALKAYKRPSSRASSPWMAAAKRQRGRGLVGETLLSSGSSLIGKLGKGILKQVLLRNAVPTYRLIANKGESLLRNYIQKKQRGKGIWLLEPATKAAILAARKARKRQKGGIFPLLAAALPTILTAVGTGALSDAAGFGVKILLDKVSR